MGSAQADPFFVLLPFNPICFNSNDALPSVLESVRRSVKKKAWLYSAQRVRAKPGAGMPQSSCGIVVRYRTGPIRVAGCHNSCRRQCRLGFLKKSLRSADLTVI